MAVQPEQKPGRSRQNYGRGMNRCTNRADVAVRL
jgi:hypothetical protein